ncbi:MAG TPA: AbrB/MazE/SpoVT family DNA-binding domain-containing protein [Candidatus Nanoarchaeia archaeon]|nr:AbrB/MazE/SpoVT family DNA-binding domain-containing protein [Candidatus Nanoarchaeia archaeon]
MEVETVAKKWGSSIGVILPKSLVEARKIKENDRIIVEIRSKKVKAGELFGILKEWKKPTQEIKNEMKRGWD